MFRVSFHTRHPHPPLSQVFVECETQLGELYRDVHRYKAQWTTVFSLEWIYVDYSSFGLALELLSMFIIS